MNQVVSGGERPTGTYLGMNLVNRQGKVQVSSIDWFSGRRVEDPLDSTFDDLDVILSDGTGSSIRNGHQQPT